VDPDTKEGKLADAGGIRIYIKQRFRDCTVTFARHNVFIDRGRESLLVENVAGRHD
jgi:hypothetical protein